MRVLIPIQILSKFGVFNEMQNKIEGIESVRTAAVSTDNQSVVHPAHSRASSTALDPSKLAVTHANVPISTITAKRVGAAGDDRFTTLLLRQLVNAKLAHADEAERLVGRVKTASHSG